MGGLGKVFSPINNSSLSRRVLDGRENIRKERFLICNLRVLQNLVQGKLHSINDLILFLLYNRSMKTIVLNLYEPS